LERLLADEDARRRRASAGLTTAALASWDVAAKQVEGALREALREREQALRASAVSRPPT
jgi:hypothetical protein